MSELDAIYRQHADTVYRFLLAKTGSPDLAEELTQETFFRAVGSIGRIDGSCQISTWLCGIAKNVLRTYCRKKHGELPLDSIAEPASESAEETVIEKTGHEQILAEIHQLPEQWREIMYLRLLGGLSFGQIGEILHQSENWARVNYYRAKQLLIKELRK